jgi:hypothetical protein
LRVIGSMLIVSESTTVSRRVVCVSTTGDAPVTVTVSSSAPTRMSALIAITPAPDTCTSSRRTDVKPARLNVTT